MLLVVAGILAVGTGLLLFNYLASVNRTAQTAPPRQVLVAARTIPARTHLTGDLLQVVQRPSNLVESDALADPQSAIGQVALIDVPAGSAITSSKIAKGVASTLPLALTPGMRAIAIPIDRVKGVAGLVQAGDRVDVIAIPPRGAHAQPTAFTILRNVRVLAMGKTMEYSSSNASPAPQDDSVSQTATLEVTPTQADRLSAADLSTTLRLALRSPHERANSVPVRTARLSDGGSRSRAARPGARCRRSATGCSRRCSRTLRRDGDRRRHRGAVGHGNDLPDHRIEGRGRLDDPCTRPHRSDCKNCVRRRSSTQTSPLAEASRSCSTP